ncbi:MAG TPA: PAS domain S-box protein, partial [Noviherbaspirillum sp.]|nr:PAS domain S-box protein [Noviherbaspirillum sp.]
MSADRTSAATSQLLDEDTAELYENAPCAYLSALPDGTLVRVNATFLAWTGYTRTELLNRKRFQQLLPVVGRIFYDTHFGPLLLMQGFVKEVAFEVICADGTRLPVLLNATLKRDESDRPLVIRVTLLDARSRRTYEEELRLAKRKAEEASESVSRLNASLEERVARRTQERDRIWRNSQDMLIVASLRGELVSFNPAVTRTLGWTSADLEGKRLVALIHPEERRNVGDVVIRLSRGQPVRRFETRNLGKDGEYRWVSWTVMPEGTLLYGIGRDVTEDRKQAEALHKAELALHQAQKMEAIGKLTGGVAHDFNNILQVIAGNLELLKRDVAGSACASQRAQIALSAVDRGAKLASQLLAFARRQPLQPVPT